MRLLKTLRALTLALICLATALLLLTGLTQGFAERRLTRALQALPDQDHIVKILALQNQGRISEALDWARYVTNNPALPIKPPSPTFPPFWKKSRPRCGIRRTGSPKGLSPAPANRRKRWAARSPPT